MLSRKLTQRLGLIAGPIAFFCILSFFHPEGLSKEANAVLAGTAWIAIWWILEAAPMAVTALLPIVLFPLTGGLDISETTASYGHKFIFLFLGGFMIAIAMQKWNLHKRIALHIINLLGTGIQRIILGFMLATAFLSMWISNTATTVMMLPIAMAIIAQLEDNPETEVDETQLFGKALMLAIAYSASIGGVATLIGTPPNLILAGILEDTYGYEISFVQWMSFGLPVSLLLLAGCWLYLTRFAFVFKKDEFPGGKQEIKRLLKALGPIKGEEKWVLLVFASLAFCWITRSYLIAPLLPGVDDTLLAVAFATLVFIIPSGKTTSGRILDWEDAVKLPWGILLLFGGGFALASGFTSSGLAAYIGTQLTTVNGLSLLLVLFIFIGSVNFLTEVTSNMATTAMLVPVIIPIAVALDTHPLLLMTGVTVAASCAFMLPVATAPNAVVFGSGHLRIPDMLRTGFWLNLFSIVLISLLTYYFLPWVWEIAIDQFPADFKTTTP
ncbi:SLC13 family permease [Croceiramulus getboli]|nr:SLC13 family permease [Flavobacteriaceae bacterium YJPT1-3]